MAIEHYTASRRGILGALAITPLLALPALASRATLGSATTPFRIAQAKNNTAIARFNSLPHDLEETDPTAFAREEAALSEAWRAVDQAPIADWNEFADAFDIACDGGVSLPNEDTIVKLLHDARRLLSNGRA